MDENVVKALYGLISVLSTNILIGWGKSIYSKHKLFRQLAAEVELVKGEIANNADRIQSQRNNGTTFPLLKELKMPIHIARIGDVITEERIGKMASGFISNCDHYNRIVELGENDSDKILRKTEVLNQGGLISNKPIQIYDMHSDGTNIPRVGSADLYLSELYCESNRYKRYAKFFPWYLLIFLLHPHDHHSDDAA